MNIILTGPMGSGKTGAGRLAARALGMEFIDTDEMVRERAGKSIKQIFSESGETGFRALEAEAIRELAHKGNCVIATGGGAVLAPGNMRLLRRNGVVINLRARPETIMGRLARAGDRPLMDSVGDNASALANMLESREMHYRACDFSMDTDRLALDDVAMEIQRVAGLPPIRICACISGAGAADDVLQAAAYGANMVELRFDLMPNPDVGGLVRESPLPVIATDRNNKENLELAIRAGCDFIDIEHDAPELGRLTALARESGCHVILSMHRDHVPDGMPDRMGADLLKLAFPVRTDEDLDVLDELQGSLEKCIIVGMGPLGTHSRVMAPMLGSYLTYCYVGRPVASGQMDLDSMMETYREMGLR